ncbi:MAG: hypothetical protein M3Q24_00775 [bacterium]|nr:hypothetical protein [bacterium]
MRKRRGTVVATLLVGLIFIISIFSEPGEDMVDGENSPYTELETEEFDIKKLTDSPEKIHTVCSVVDSVLMYHQVYENGDVYSSTKIFLADSSKTVVNGFPTINLVKERYYSFSLYRENDGSFVLIDIDPVGSCINKEQPKDSTAVFPKLDRKILTPQPIPTFTTTPPSFAGGFL